MAANIKKKKVFNCYTAGYKALVIVLADAAKS